MTNLILPERNVNILGLRKAHAELYKYLLKCVEENKAVSIDDVAEIYYNYSRKTVLNYDWKSGEYKRINAQKDFYERREKFRKGKGEGSYRYLYRDTQNWLKGCIGLFVMRGLMVAMPKFNPKEVEQIID